MKKANLRKRWIAFFVLFCFFSCMTFQVKAKTIDEIYSAAYNAVVFCKASGTQESINEARKAIDKLKGTSAAFAIGEFSKQTDFVQQKLFEEFMALLYNSNGSPKNSMTQSEINSAREMVISFSTYSGNKPYISSWSSAVDKYQQLHINEAEKLVNIAKQSRKNSDILKAQNSVNSLLTAKNNPTIITHANGLLAIIKTITPIDGIDAVIAGRPGHNFNSIGAVGILSEVNVNRDIFSSVSKNLSQVTNFIDCTPYDNPSDSKVDLAYGVNKANNSNADFFFSIHLNKAFNEVQDYPMGAEVLVYDANSKDAIAKGKAVLENLQKLGFKNRGIKYRPDLYELKNTVSEAMIIECFFLESKADTDLYNSIGPEKIGQAIANGIDSRVPFSAN